MLYLSGASKADILNCYTLVACEHNSLNLLIDENQIGIKSTPGHWLMLGVYLKLNMIHLAFIWGPVFQ